MEQPVFVGLDVHRKSITATVLDREGNRLDQSRFNARDQDLIDYLGSLPRPQRVVLEACNVWEHCFDAAASTGAQVVLAHPFKTRIITDASLKSDKVDSQALAQLLRLNAVPEAFAPPQEIRDQRQLVRDRAFYLQQEHSIKNHTYSILLRRGVEYEDGILGMKKKREELRLLHLPEVDRGLDALLKIEETVKDLDRAIHEAYLQSKEARLLATIPGIGELTAMILVAELCPIERFANVEKVCAYAGLVPTSFQSGESAHHGHLRNDSNHLLRWILVEAAWKTVANEKNGEVARVSKRVSRRRGKGKGHVAGAHKLLKIVYAVLRRGTPYTPERPSSVLGSARS